MENHCICPHCRGHLRVGEYIVLKIRNSRREKGLLLLHCESEGYTSMKHPNLNFREGERIDYFCPLCMQSLDAAEDENLVRVIMIDPQHTEHEIYFSRIAGKQGTYPLSGEEVNATAEHSSRYTHFNMSDELFQYL